MNLKMFRSGLIIATIAVAGLASVVSEASEVINIPYSQAQPVADAGYCYAYVPFNGTAEGFIADGDTCTLEFPLPVPVGHFVQQIAVLHSTDSIVPGQFVAASVEVIGLAPVSYSEEFFWLSFTSVPNGVVDRHPLMGQVNTPHGILYTDAFSAAPKTTYHVQVQMRNETIEGIEVTYN